MRFKRILRRDVPGQDDGKDCSEKETVNQVRPEGILRQLSDHFLHLGKGFGRQCSRHVLHRIHENVRLDEKHPGQVDGAVDQRRKQSGADPQAERVVVGDGGVLCGKLLHKTLEQRDAKVKLESPEHQDNQGASDIADPAGSVGRKQGIQGEVRRRNAAEHESGLCSSIPGSFVVSHSECKYRKKFISLRAKYL